MTDHEHIVSRMDAQSELIKSQNLRLENIERIITSIAVQEEKMNNIHAQMTALWKKYDAAFAPDGIIASLKAAHIACPAEAMRTAMARQWWAIGLLASLTTGTILKAIGVI